MPGLVMPRPHLFPRQTLIIAHMCPLPDLPKIATRMLPIAVQVVFVHAFEVLGGQRGEVALAHDLLADVIDAVACVGGRGV